jgi:hypothetical protein
MALTPAELVPVPEVSAPRVRVILLGGKNVAEVVSLATTSLRLLVFPWGAGTLPDSAYNQVI